MAMPSSAFPCTMEMAPPIGKMGKSGETIKVSVHNGRYEVFLGGQGMNSLTPELFLKNDPLLPEGRI